VTPVLTKQKAAFSSFLPDSPVIFGCANQLFKYEYVPLRYSLQTKHCDQFNDDSAQKHKNVVVFLIRATHRYRHIVVKQVSAGKLH